MAHWSKGVSCSLLPNRMLRFFSTWLTCKKFFWIATNEEVFKSVCVLCSGYLYLWAGNKKLQTTNVDTVKTLTIRKSYPIKNIEYKIYRNTCLRKTLGHVYKTCTEICVSELQKENENSFFKLFFYVIEYGIKMN